MTLATVANGPITSSNLTLRENASQIEARDLAHERLRKVSVKLEATFLAEMLKHAGVGKPRETFGGGTGEDQFGSFLRQAQAEEIAKNGGIGLAEHLFEALKERQNESV